MSSLDQVPQWHRQDLKRALISRMLSPPNLSSGNMADSFTSTTTRVRRIRRYENWRDGADGEVVMVVVVVGGGEYNTVHINLS